MRKRTKRRLTKAPETPIAWQVGDWVCSLCGCRSCVDTHFLGQIISIEVHTGRLYVNWLFKDKLPPELEYGYVIEPDTLPIELIHRGGAPCKPSK